MKNILLIALIALSSTLTCAQETGLDLIAASIKFHDPGNNWPSTKIVMNFSDTRPGKDARSAILYLNNEDGTLCLRREMAGKNVTRHIVDDNCSYDIDGNFSPSAEEIEKFSLNNKRSLMMRNYYLYLWGLPMKLTDPGTIVDPQVYDKEFDGRKTKAVRVTYDAKVGSDIWYFYFDPTTSEMIGYRFYHDEAKGDGEYILLSGLHEINGMKIPKNRAWYTNPDSTLLGTDHLISTETLQHKH